MLVLTRRENQKLLFPGLGIEVSVLRIGGSIVKVGIEAPADVKVIRDELAFEQSLTKNVEQSGTKLNADQRHRLKNLLSPVTIGLQLLQKLVETQNLSQIESIFERIKGALQELENEVVAWRSEPKKIERRCRALLIEDDPNERELLAAYLRASGIEVITAEDGAEGIDYLEHQSLPDVVLVDMQMPRCDGPTFVAHIRANQDLKGLKMFAVSGTDPSECSIPSGPTGVDLWFSKPLNPQRLAMEVAALNDAA